MSVLTKSHKVIELFLCYIGLDLLQGQQGFGYEFWRAMHAKEYRGSLHVVQRRGAYLIDSKKLG